MIRTARMKKWWEKPAVIIPAVTLLCWIVFILVVLFLGGDWDGWFWEWESFKAGFDPTWQIALAFGGIYGLILATYRAKSADKQATAANEQAKESNRQTDIASRSNHAQRYEKASEMLWHLKEAGMREAGCYALKSLGLGDVEMAFQCRDLLVSFIQRSVPTPKQKEDHQEELSRSDIVAADHALSSLYQEWCNTEGFRSFPLKSIPAWFWREGELPLRRGYPGGNLSGAKLSHANFENANLRGADLSNKAILSHANLRGADLSHADLWGADLHEADLWSASLDNADLSAADLRNANLGSAGLSQAKLCGADLSAADLLRARLRNADLRGADLRKADLRNAILSETNLREANLSEADLSNADLRGADLRKANLSKVDFGGVYEVQAAKYLTSEQIESAVWDRSLGPPQLPYYLAVDVNKMGAPLIRQRDYF